MAVQNLKEICKNLKEDEAEINKNFWAVNMHGDETKEEFVVPKGIRIIMFCYPGRKLDICPRFDKFNWREIFLNEDASFNYCTFLSNLVQYSSLRNHFCVYEEGAKMLDLELSSDPLFRNGIYQLPVQAAVYDPQTEQIYMSSSEIFDKVIAKMDKVKRISVDREKTAKIVKDKETDAIIFSKVINIPKIKLSELIRKLRTKIGQAYPSDLTLLLLTCRTGEKQRGILRPPTVYEELEKLYQKYARV
jgi:hypothetical protein